MFLVVSFCISQILNFYSGHFFNNLVHIMNYEI